jgi:non-ribosomal peptide synthase protein (TIGR01720 family)
MEGHGREELFDDVDLSRTVGWFTTLYPVTLAVPDGDWAGAVRAARRTLRGVPGRGLGYGALRYLSGPDQPGHALADQAAPEISFNYLGRWDLPAGGQGLVQGQFDAPGDPSAPEQVRAHLVDIVAAVVDGALQVDWTHSPDIHHTATVEGLAHRFERELRRLVRHAPTD